LTSSFLVVVGLGSNLGDRAATLEGAFAALGALPATRLLARSSTAETAPIGPPQGEYLNAAALLETSLPPVALLDLLLGIERSFGRERRVRWGPRTLDLDLLWIDGQQLDTERLVVPHPHLRERIFALAPLLEVAPDARDPLTSERYADVLAALLHGQQPR
jgi:2-amino-4-hydroxy-6-hydroxymethyldihydropteridine diphosphokinase